MKRQSICEGNLIAHINVGTSTLYFWNCTQLGLPLRHMQLRTNLGLRFPFDCYMEIEVLQLESLNMCSKYLNPCKFNCWHKWEELCSYCLMKILILTSSNFCIPTPILNLKWQSTWFIVASCWDEVIPSPIRRPKYLEVTTIEATHLKPRYTSTPYMLEQHSTKLLYRDISLYSVFGDFSWFWDYLRTWFSTKDQEKHNNIFNVT